MRALGRSRTFHLPLRRRPLHQVSYEGKGVPGFPGVVAAVRIERTTFGSWVRCQRQAKTDHQAALEPKCRYGVSFHVPSTSGALLSLCH
jgi:hypothetical protein